MTKQFMCVLFQFKAHLQAATHSHTYTDSWVVGGFVHVLLPRPLTFSFSLKWQNSLKICYKQAKKICFCCLLISSSTQFIISETSALDMCNSEAVHLEYLKNNNNEQMFSKTYVFTIESLCYLILQRDFYKHNVLLSVILFLTKHPKRTLRISDCACI